MNEWREEREKYIMFLLSITLHILFILALLFFTMQHTDLLDKIPFLKELKEENPLLPIPQTNLAALKPGGASFGAPLVFQEEPEFEPTEQSPMTNDVVTQEEDDEQEDAEEMQHEQQEMQPQPEETVQTPPEQPTQQVEQLPVEESTHTVAIPPEKQPEQPMKPEPKPEEKPQPPQELSSPAEKRAKRQQLQRESPDNPGQGEKAAAPVKPRVTLADLAKGFIESINKGGQDFLERDGDPNIRPDFKDLKYLSYIQKAVWYMQNEWKLAQSKLELRTSQELILSIIITILKDGSVSGIRIAKPSGSNELDSFLIRGIEKASPLPPVPNHFGTDNFELPLSIIHRQEGGSPWRMRLPTRHRPL